MKGSRFSVLVAATRGPGDGVWRLFAVRDTRSEAEQVVREQRIIDSRPPRGRYRYRIKEDKMAAPLFSDTDFITLSPQQADEFRAQAQRHEFHDLVYGGSVIAWRHRDGRVYVEKITLSSDPLAG